MISGLGRGAHPSSSSSLRIFDPATDLEVFAVSTMPFSINVGQVGVAPITLTLDNPGLANGADILLDRLRLRLEDESGQDLVPAAVLDRVLLREGVEIYAEETVMPATGAEVDIVLARPVRIPVSQPVSLSVQLDISPNTQQPNFRLVLADASSLQASDAISLAPVPVNLPQGTFPIVSGLGRLVAPSGGVTARSVAALPRRFNQGQHDTALLEVELENIQTSTLSGAVMVGSIGVQLMDASGAPLPQPSQVLSRFRVESPLGALLESSVSSSDGEIIHLDFAQPLEILAGAPVTLQALADLQPGAAPGDYQLQLSSPTDVEAVDANSGDAVPSGFESSPLGGPVFSVESPALSLLVAGTARLPSSLIVGARDVSALDATLRHPGGAGVGSILVESVDLRVQDESRSGIVPAAVLDRVAIVREGVVVGESTAPPVAGASIPIDLADVRLEPGTSVTLTVQVDIEVSAPQSYLEFEVSAADLVAVDGNEALPIQIEPEPASSFPLRSGLTRLQPPADAVSVGLQSRAPPTLAAGSTGVWMASLTLANPTTSETGNVVVDGLTFSALGRALEPILIGDAATAVQASQSGQPWASSPPIAPSDGTTELTPVTPLSLSPGDQITLEIHVDLGPEPTTEFFRLVLEEAGVHVVQPGGASLTIRVDPAPGQQFPLVSESGRFAPLDLGKSYSNFPDPFAAGRETTTFAYYLPRDASVSLRVLTPRGETVATLVDREARSAGLHQDQSW
ncbi:MAG: hypothetical protein HKO53_20150, partial [Gemmatimonadetes bacterium]|nr:hypothetical protein [Gemmatimonadota bacterium]